MSNYEITIQVDMRETEHEVTQGAQPSADGRFRILTFPLDAFGEH